MHDDRYLRLQALYSAAGRFNTAGTGVASYAVGFPGAGPSLIDSGSGVVPASAGADADAVVAAKLANDAIPGLRPIVGPAKAVDYGYGIDYTRGTRVVTHTAGGVTHVLTFNLNMGGMVQSWTRSGVELLNFNNSGRRGLQAVMSWTDAYAGELFQHTAVQGGDRNATSVLNHKGGIVTNFSEVDNIAEGSKTVTIDFIPIEADPAGFHSVPFIRADHGGSATQPVYWTTLPMRLTIKLCVSGASDRHRLTVEAYPDWSVTTAGTDASIAVYGCFDTGTFTDLVAWDGATRTGISSGTSGVTGYQADFAGTIMDSTKLVDDNEADDSSLIARSGLVSVAAGTGDTDAAVGIGNVLYPEVKSVDRKLGDAPSGNAWCWVQNNGGSGDENFIGVGYGQFLSSRIHSSTALRVIPSKGDGGIRSECFMYTRTNLTNEVAFA